MKKIITLGAITLLIWGCSHKLTSQTAVNPAPSSKVMAVANLTEVATTKSGLRPADSSAILSPQIMGQTTFTAKCGKCHALKTTTDYTAESWSKLLDAMAPKAHLTDEEKANVLAYVQANAKQQ